ncbi:MAG: retron St85 family RNA-directed DNA polymerase [Acidobacteria bacterium]|nr:retron St85 family RNA-directed DNA polymerase [Acidobacteriota bacterium]
MNLRDYLASALLLPAPYLDAISRSASRRYKRLFLPKRDGSKREVFHPSRELKLLQRWLAETVVSKFPVHPAATAYRPGLGIRQNAERHLENRFLLRLDLKEFFPSIQEDDIRAFLALQSSVEGATTVWDEDSVGFFLGIVLKDRRLCIGAPSSPALSNAVCIELDRNLDALASGLDGTYSRYADDLFFSTNRIGELGAVERRVAEILRRLSYPRGLALNRDKTRYSSMKTRRAVTGVVLTCERQASSRHCSLGRKRKRLLRGMIHRLESLDMQERLYLAGWLAHAKSLEPDFINRLVLKFGSDRIIGSMNMNWKPAV